MEKISRVWRSGLAMLLALCMVAGMCPVVAFAEEHETPEKTAINYVSLGDSMSNGYGLEGYEGNNGVYDYGKDSYANQFAEWLAGEGGYADKVNHTGLAMSAMRAEDLHWLLELDYEDNEAIAITDMPNWDEARWNAKFSAGDHWTWNDLCNNYRFATAATYILAERDGDADALAALNPDANGKYRNPEARYVRTGEAKIVAELYQSAVREADIISLGIGNGNFGVFLAGRILEAVGFDGDPEDTMIFKVERAIAECEPAMQTEIRKLIDKLYAAVEDYLGEPIDDGDDNTTSTMEALANSVVYTGISYVLNFAGSIEAILQLNPDVEIILVGLMNTFSSLESSEDGKTSLGDLLEIVYTPLNSYIAALPTFMQAAGNSVYDEATFYYAEAPKVDCMVEVYGEDFYNEDGTPNTDSLTRKRFVADIVGTASDPGLVWGLFNGAELVDGITLVPVTFEEICEYDGLQPADKAVYTAADAQKAGSIAAYLAFEDAIKHAADGTPVSIEAILGLGGLDDSSFAGVKAFFDNTIDGIAVGYFDPACEAASQIIRTQGADLSTDTFTMKEIVSLIAMQGEKAGAEQIVWYYMSDARKQFGIDMGLEDFKAAGEAGELGTAQDLYLVFQDQVASSAVSLKTYDIPDTVSMLSMRLALPETLSVAIQEDISLSGLLGLFARCIIGNGLGAHPSAKGHEALFNAVKTAYREVYTASDRVGDDIEKLISKVIEIMKETQPSLDTTMVEALAKLFELQRDRDDLLELDKDTADVDEQIKLVKEIMGEEYASATTGQYDGDCDFYYVALGDGTSVSDSYVDALAETLQVKYNNLSVAGTNVIDGFAIVEEKAKEIADADLITLGYGNNTFFDFTVANLLNAIQGVAVDIDWRAYVNAEGVAYIENVLGVIHDKLMEAGMNKEMSGVNLADLMTLAVESYAYSCVAYACNLPELINDIRAINSDATVVVVGMHNPLERAVIVEDGMKLTIGEYLDYLVYAAEFHALSYSMMSNNCIYVAAPEVTTDANVEEIEMLAFLNLFIGEESRGTMEPNDAGHAYIRDQLLTALTVEMKPHEVDSNGHKCGICGETISECTDEDKDHACDVCGENLSKCADTNKDHKCDYCGDAMTKCLDADDDHICDICGKKVLNCVDKDNDHKCDDCGEVISECEDANKDHKCDTCQKVLSECADANKDHKCDTCGKNLKVDEDSETVSGVIRLSGKERTATARKIADEVKAISGAEKFDAIVYAIGDAFADTLTGTYLANMEGAPILLYRESGAAENLEYIKKNLSEDGFVYILGGIKAIPASVDAALREEGVQVVRLTGKTRFETNIEILEEAGFVGGETVLVCTGFDYADSLAASATGMPILLVDNGTEELRDAQVEYLKGLDAKCDFVVIGGTAAVSEDLVDELEAYDADGKVERMSGKTRYETSILLAETYFDAEHIVLAYGREFADGMCGGTLAYALGAPIVLTEENVTDEAADYTKETGIISGYVVGGTGRLSDTSVRTIFRMATSDEISVK